MNQTEKTALLLSILAQACGVPASALRPETELLDSDLLDSLALIELLEGIEDSFGTVLEPTRIPREQFRTPQQILALLDAEQQNPFPSPK